MRYRSRKFQLFFDQITQAILDFIMPGNGTLFSIFVILVNVMFFAMALHETPVPYKIADESVSFQNATSISFIRTSVRLMVGSVSNISS